MAVVATAAVDYSFTPGPYTPLMVYPSAPLTFGSFSSYTPLMVYPSAPVSSGPVGSFDPWPSAGPPPVNYYQRVWSVGSNVWCYYTKTIVDPNPLSTETTPPWVGSSSSPSVISVS